jgi:hypothetical protein
MIECVDGIDAEEEWWEGKNLSDDKTGIFPVLFTKGWKEVAKAHQPALKDLPTLARQLSHASKGSSVLKNKRLSMLPVAKENSVSEYMKSFKSSENLTDNIFSARVLYSYDSTCAGELTIEVGEVLTDISVNTGSDQWWEGSGKHGRGQFPSPYAAPLRKDPGNCLLI